jgi:flagellar biosynthetic protein FliR
MMELALNMGWLEAVMLGGVRLVAFLVVAPPFSFGSFPIRVKAMLAIALAVAVAPRISEGYQPMDTAGYFSALAIEVLLGLLLGFLVFVGFAAVQAAGNLVDLFGGFQLAQAFDPQSMVNGAQFTRLFHMAALALLFSTDGYQLILGGLMRTFTAMPVGTGVDLSASTEVLVAGIPAMFLAALQIAGPLLVVLFLADVGIGLLTRVAPAINAFAMGFPLKILLTVVFAGTLFLGLPRIVAAIVEQATTTLLGVN